MGLGSWEDGAMEPEDDEPYHFVANTSVYTNCWSNRWELGQGDRAYKFANAGYKVCLVQLSCGFRCAGHF